MSERDKPMPDRAVVDTKTIRAALQKVWDDGCDKCGGTMVMWADIGDMRCQQCGRTGDEIEGELLGSPPPRALVALSEDRQWLVVRGQERWGIYRYYLRTIVQGLSNAGAPSYRAHASVEDTGQSAHAVLADWVARHDGG